MMHAAAAEQSSWTLHTASDNRIITHVPNPLENGPCPILDTGSYSSPVSIKGHALIEELHKCRHVKTGERREVVDRASQKGLPRFGFDENNMSETT
jgi:hypothetical protein